MRKRKIVSNWRDILKKAWSVRFFALCIACQLTDVLLSSVGALSKHVELRIYFQMCGVLFSGLGLWARFVYQKSISEKA